MIDQLLMSWEEYNKKESGLSRPYIFTIRNPKKYLLFFGARHVYDPKDLQFNQLREALVKFLKETKENNCLVLVEGNRFLANSEEEGIKHGGEGGFITFLANQKNIPVVSPEPPFLSLYQELTKQFPREYIYYMRMAQWLAQWHRLLDENKQGFEKYFSEGYLKGYKEEFGWSDFDFSIENIKIIHKNLFNNDFDGNNGDFFYQISRPDKEISIINEVARAASLIRNIYIVEQIKKYWDDGKNIFIVYGSGHAIIQEPALRALLK